MYTRLYEMSLLAIRLANEVGALHVPCVSYGHATSR